MAETEQRSGQEGDKLYTLSQISKLTGVSMPTLQRYKKTYQDRIPSVGEGRRQRYPENALPVFNELKIENAGRRGRPRKDASGPRPSAVKPAAGRRPGRKAASARPVAKAAPARGRGRAAAAVVKPAAKSAVRRGRPPGVKNAPGRKPQAAAQREPARSRRNESLMTLTQISKDTGISYPTLVRYVRLHEGRLPHEGTGRGRRFYPKAVEVFRSLREESGRGGRKRGAASAAPAAAARGREDAGISRQLKSLEKSQQALERKLDLLLRNLKKAFG